MNIYIYIHTHTFFVKKKFIKKDLKKKKKSIGGEGGNPMCLDNMKEMGTNTFTCEDQKT